ncbi:unnamed protein product [Larinioides sclopetarius]|uniref:Uncharacterized protein n=1 Tax=Larinioides sclopetarius TaxID=280406 RepID=A0AAV2BKB3_9ARAC
MFVDKKPYSSHPHTDLHDSQERNPWLYHRLCKKDEHLENIEEVRAWSSSDNSKKEATAIGVQESCFIWE